MTTVKIFFTDGLFVLQLHRSLQERAGKRTSLVLSMDQMSGKLANLTNTVIAMPGISSNRQVWHWKIPLRPAPY